MNKISKKIVALVTMAAFVLTLVPAAAFAAIGTGVSYDASGVAAQDDSNAVTVTAGDSYDVKVLVQNKENLGLAGIELDTNPNAVKIWATENGEFTDAVEFTDTALENSANANIKRFVSGTTVTNGKEIEATFSRPGTYVIHLGVGNVNSGANKVDEAFATGFENCGKTLTVTVEKADVTTEAVTLTDEWENTLNFNDGIAVLNLVNQDQFHVNGSDTYTIKGIAYQDAAKTKVAAYETFNLVSDKTNVLQLTKGEVTTNNAGEFEIVFRMTEKQNANITLSNDDVTYTIRVIEDVSNANDIDTVKDGGYVLDGETANKYKEEYLRNLGDAVQFTITDSDGDVVTGDDAIANEPAYSTGTANHAQYIAVLSKPDKSKLDGSKLELIADGDAYTLKYASSWADMAKDLIPGKYTVRVSLLSGDYADATFTVSEFGTVEDTVIDMEARNTAQGSDQNYYSISDEVTLGQRVHVTAKYVDGNGLKIPATNVQYGFDGKAVTNSYPATGYFDTVDDTITNEALLGSEIIVTAFDASEKQLVQKTLTVVDSYNTYSLAFDPTEGPAGEDNKVEVSVVDANEKLANKVQGTLMAYVADQSNKDAKVSVNIDNADVENGKGELVVYADKATEVDVVVAVKNTTGAIYAKTLTFIVGDAAVNADRSVVMTIGSTEYVVNNKLVTGDAAPYVNADYRTMVPIRALAESFDADVNYNNDDRTVTIKDGDNTIVMTIDKDTYTVNGEEQTMDTAAVIGEGDRTYVPVRFAAEALGYTVTPLYDSNNLTASVVFQK